MYITAKVPSTLSTVHPHNCALAHVLAAERIDRSDVGGHAFFVRDFEANVVDMNVESFKNTDIKPTLISLRLAYGMAWMLDLIDRLLHLIWALFGRTYRTSKDVLSIQAVGMAWIDIVVSDRNARDKLGYRSVVPQSDTMREAQEYCTSFYSTLKKN